MEETTLIPVTFSYARKSESRETVIQFVELSAVDNSDRTLNQNFHIMNQTHRFLTLSRAANRFILPEKILS